MTTMTAPETLSTTPLALPHRLASIARLHLANPWTTITLPWMILGIIFLGNYLIWLLIFAATPESAHADISEGLGYSGAASYIFVYMMVVAIQAMNSTFAFALGYGATRRDYYLGTSVVFVGLSAMYAVGLTVLSIIEELTGGWGLGGRMSTALFFGSGPALERLVIFFLTFLFFFFVGAAIATVYVRWKGFGITVFFVVIGFLLIGLGALVVFTDGWAAIGAFFTTAGFLGSFASSLVVTVIAAVAGFLILRRATPRS